MKAKIAIFLTALFLTLPSGLFAQTITLSKIEIDNKLLAPSMGDSLYTKAGNSNKKWMAFLAHYKVKMDGVKAKSIIDNGKWLDDVEVKWDILYKPEAATNKIQNYIKLTKVVKYKNVGEGEHTAVVLIDTKNLERYFLEGKTAFMRELKLRFSMKVSGKTVKNMTTYLVKGKQDKKGEFAKYFDHEDSYKLDGILLNRNESPFRYSQIDYFDTIVEDDK